MAYGDNIFTAIISEDGTIYEASTGRKRQAVGIDLQKEQEYIKTISDMQETLDNYYGKLIELGVIQLPRTAEEMAAEQLQMAQEQARQQAQINQSLLDAINVLNSEIKEMKTNVNVGNSYAISDNAIGQDSESNREKSAGSQKRTGTRKEANPTDNEQS